MRSILIAMGLVVSLNWQAHAAPFYGAFLCDFVKATPASEYGYHVGDQIILGVTDFEINWVSAFGPGLSFRCTRTGDILVCPLGEAQDYTAKQTRPNSVFDMTTKKFVRAVAGSEEEWRCKRFKLGYSGTVNASDPE